MTSSQIGEQIREARQARGLSLRALAEKVGIHFSHLSKIENGKDTVGRDTLIRIAEELGVDPDFMLGEAGHGSMPFRLLGTVAAGVPIETIEDVESFDLSDAFDPREHFLLRVKGDSMILDGINDGDLAVIRQSATAKNGDTVVAIVDGDEATLKRFEKRKNKVMLKPANADMTEMIFPASSVEIRGVLSGVIRTSVR
ncbi:MAG: transcriptional repressor LexA [Planctomycetales bacterium]|jgi:SOS regulatory protein LexA